MFFYIHFYMNFLWWNQTDNTYLFISVLESISIFWIHWEVYVWSLKNRVHLSTATKQCIYQNQYRHRTEWIESLVKPSSVLTVRLAVLIAPWSTVFHQKSYINSFSYANMLYHAINQFSSLLIIWCQGFLHCSFFFCIWSLFWVFVFNNIH